jgi:serine protease AprX
MGSMSIGLATAPPRGAARRITAALLAAVTVGCLLTVAAPAAATPAAAGELLPVIVRTVPGAGPGLERLVRQLGGQIARRLGIIDAFAAVVPAGRVELLESAAGVTEVTPNRPVRLMGTYDGVATESRMSTIIEAMDIDTYWHQGYTGKGVGVALIDSGVAPVTGLAQAGKVVHGPDLSFESQSAAHRYVDTFGHGTHMAGIIAGRDPGAPKVTDEEAEEYFMGVAPDAKIISVKVADQAGATDISQIIAAIDWVVQHRNDPGLNIKVLNLSFGTDGEQSYTLDPLAYAAEVAWRAGITVVVAAGNSGYGSPKLNNPAYDPFVIAVGAADIKGTIDNDDDVPAPFSSAGDASRKPDFIAPGKSIASLAVPGSALDQAYPAARRGTRFFLGSGTSQAAAAVSGAAALVAQQRPTANADQIKAILKRTADVDATAGTEGQSGAGIMDLSAAYREVTPSASAAAQPFTKSTGQGKLDLARGSTRLVNNGVTLNGERDIFGTAFNSGTWAAKAGTTAWTGGTWNSKRWSGDGWSGTTWASATWAGSAWSGTTWASVTYSGSRWTGSRWTGGTWTGSRWTGSRWTSNSWSSAGWS